MMKFAMMLLVSFGAMAAAQAACPEGRVSVFHEQDPYNSDRTITVTRTCRNGSYYDLSNYVYNPKSRCVEGARQVFTEHDNNDHSKIVIRTCKDGRYYPKAKAIDYSRIRCVEGTVNVSTEHDNDDRSHTVISKCVGGKYVTISKN